MLEGKLVTQTSPRGPYPVIVQGWFTSRGLLTIGNEGLEIEKKSLFGKPRPWFSIGFDRIEAVSLHAPHLLVRDESDRLREVTLTRPAVVSTVLEHVESRVKAATLPDEPGTAAQAHGQRAVLVPYWVWRVAIVAGIAAFFLARACFAETP
jgi:hypothetical protein